MLIYLTIAPQLLPMIIEILTIFPDFFKSPLQAGVIRRAIDAGIIDFRTIDLRDFTHDRHRTTDDRPFGGGEGMVMIPGPIFEAVDTIRSAGPAPYIVMLSPGGMLLDQELARNLSEKERLVFICGRYEGVDHRVVQGCADMELSIGDYVLSGGETAALVAVEVITRFVPGVLGCDSSAENDSFSTGLLEHPQYTRPREFRGMAVPEVLLNGNHAEIERWRRRQSLKITAERRPDLLKHATLTQDDRKYLKTLGMCSES